jgi:hypothetical protein
MANNYLQFSFQIENVSKEGWDFLNEESERQAEEEDWQEWQWDYETNGDVGIVGSVWVYAEEYGNPDALASVLSAYLKKFDPKGRITFTWAATCAKLRLDEFTGGGVVILADEIHFMSADDWVSRMGV